VSLTGLDLFWWFGLIFVFVLVPAVDLLAGEDTTSPPEEALQWLEDDRYYRWVTYLYLPIQYGALVWVCALIANGDLETFDKVGLAMTLGAVAGVGINTAHELGHKKEEHERWLARIALAQPFYGHFYIEHNRGHHRRVATPEDPASSRVGENVYAFWLRAISGSLVSAWRIERSRLARRGQSHWTLRNDVLSSWALSVLLWGAVVAGFGVEVLPYLVIQALLGILLLESVNYLEHYGMKRRVDATGRPERVNASHSWNSNNIATNVLLYHLQRHSDHHANPTRRYQALRDYKEAPILPTGYAGMILLALVPPLWRVVMDHRVEEHFDGDLSRANLHPRVRARVPAR
jgi:alkane 1-monooxygenase